MDAKYLFVGLAIVVTSLCSKAQIPDFKSNTTEQEKQQSVIYSALSNKYDFVIAFSSQSYWWENVRSYKILAIKDGVFFKGTYYSKANRKQKWSKPTVKITIANKDTALAIINHFKENHFWSLNRDTLNISEKTTDTITWSMDISDGTNYKFETFVKEKFSIIESYQPEEMLKFIPELKAREIFINCRDWFFAKYKKL